jgi:hypothetical protein
VDLRRPKQIAGTAEMQPILREKFVTHFFPLVEHQREDVDEAGIRPIGESGPDEFIGVADLGQRPGSRRARLDGDEDQRDQPEAVIEPLRKGAKELFDALRRGALVEIIFPRVEDDGTRLQREDQPVHLLNAIRQRGAPEAAIDHGQAGKILSQRLPQADGRAAIKQDRIAWHRRPCFLFGEGTKFLGKLGDWRMHVANRVAAKRRSRQPQSTGSS